MGTSLRFARLIQSQILSKIRSQIFLALIAFITISVKTSSSLAAVAVSEIRNASRITGVGTGTITVYGGTAGNFSRCGLSGGNSDTVCNNCRIPDGAAENAGDSNLLACNPARIYPSLILRIRMSSDAVDGVPAITDSTGNNPIPIFEFANVTVPKGTVVEIGVLWKDICDRIFASSSPSQQEVATCMPQSQVTGQIRVGFSSAEAGGTTLTGTGTDSRVVQFVLRSQAGQAADFSSDVSTVLPCSDPTSVGLCDFTVGPGDEKAVLKRFEAASSDFPVSTSTTFSFARLLFSNQGFEYVHAGSPYVDLPISATQPFTISPKRIEGLKNDIRYYFKVAVVDAAGNVGYYTPTAGQSLATQSTIPSEVVGVLSENDCFIATAAYGSPLAKEINSLRQFRSLVMLDTGWGRSLVRLYYKHSPPLAEWIAGSPNARSIVKHTLGPIVKLAQWTLTLPRSAQIPFGLLWVSALITIFLTVTLGPIFGLIALAQKIWRRNRSSNAFVTAAFIALSAASINLATAPPALAKSTPRFATKASQKPARKIAAENQQSQPQQSQQLETPPEPEFPQPGAKLNDEFESSSAGSSSSAKAPEPTAPPPEAPVSPAATAAPAPGYSVPRPPESTLATREDGVQPIKRPKAVSEEGDYFYGGSDATDTKTYGKPKAPVYKSKRGRESPIQTSEAGEFFYKLDQSELGGSAGFRFGVIETPSIQNPDNGLFFKDIYGQNPLPAFLFDYEIPLTRDFGRIGIRLESGLFISSAQGRFRRADRALDEADERFTFIMVPLTANLIYRFQFADTQFVVPFVEGGGGYYGITELRDDAKEPRIGGAPVASFGGGFSFLLDMLDRKAVSQLDQDYGINHVWFTVQARQIIGLKSSIDLTTRQYSAGLTLDF